MNNKEYYGLIISLKIKDFETGKRQMTLEDAESMYFLGYRTIYKNGKIKIEEEI